MINKTLLHIHTLFEDTVPEYWVVFSVYIIAMLIPSCTELCKYVQAKKSRVISSYIPNNYQICAQTRIRVQVVGVSTVII